MYVLAEVARGRDNNLNLIRFIAASAVLVSHAWPIALGPDAIQPLSGVTGHALGSIAVYIFFAISGFLIAASFERRSSLRAFLLARTLRLFPGLLVSLLLVALIMGPVVTELPLSQYLSHPDVMAFLVRNTTLVFPQYTLPGVFQGNPYPMVEGSIWTLIHEVLCYCLVFFIGVLGLLRRQRAMVGVLLLYATIWVLPELVEVKVHPRLMAARQLSLPFMIGVAFWVWRDRLVLSMPLAIALVLAASILRSGVLAYPVFVLAVSYVTFWIAYVPRGGLRHYNRIGDYSYGLYIYAFPIQGLAVWLVGPQEPLTNIAISFPVSLVLAILSWHFIEEPALRVTKRAVPLRTDLG